MFQVVFRHGCLCLLYDCSASAGFLLAPLLQASRFVLSVTMDLEHSLLKNEIGEKIGIENKGNEQYIYV